MEFNGILSDIDIDADTAGLRSIIYDGDGKRAAYIVKMADMASQGVKINLRAQNVTSVEIFADMKPVDCKWRFTDDGIEVVLPEFRSSCIIKTR